MTHGLSINISLTKISLLIQGYYCSFVKNKVVMTQIKLEIENCTDCPHMFEKRVYTADSFENAYDWLCKKSDNRKIAGYVDWNEEVKIPDWCPCKI